MRKESAMGLLWSEMCRAEMVVLEEEAVEQVHHVVLMGVFMHSTIVAVEQYSDGAPAPPDSSCWGRTMLLSASDWDQLLLNQSPSQNMRPMESEWSVYKLKEGTACPMCGEQARH